MRTQQGTDSVSLLYAKQILMKKQITIDTQFLERAEGSFRDGRSRIKYLRHENNKHLMTGPKGNSEFCFPETSMFPEGNIEARGETKLAVSRGASH